jgi:hypothetical protein
MKFSRYVFAIAGLYGLVTLIPGYFLEAIIASNDSPPITHAEFFYGFIGVALAWQIMFFVIAFDPPRYRLAMLIALLEKLAFGVAAVVLFALHRVATPVLGLGLIDLALGVLFLIAYFATQGSPSVGVVATKRSQADCDTAYVER